MFKYAFNKPQLVWIANNLGTVLKVMILMALVISFMFNPDVVLAEPVMGGSVGRAAKTINLIKLP